jgi:hypothetical protein
VLANQGCICRAIDTLFELGQTWSFHRAYLHVVRSIRGGFSLLAEQQFPERPDGANAIPLKILKQSVVNVKHICLLDRGVLSGFLIYPHDGSSRYAGGMRSHPREKTGRNDPCPCGSGKKYKQCCLSKATLAFPGPETLDTPWSRQRDASDHLTADLMRLMKRDFGDALLDAWADFNQDDDPVPLSDMPEEISIFSPYVLFEWDPEKPLRRRALKPRGGVVAQAYLKKAASRLSGLEYLILEQAITRPVSFYEIVRVHPGQGAVLRDLLIGEETEIEEHSGSETMRPGDVLYAQIWILPEVATLGRLAPRPIPPGRKVEIIKLRAQLQRKIKRQNRELAAADLTRYADEIRTVYLDIRDALNKPPTLLNTDGEPFLSHKLHFNTQSAQSTFDALAPLAWGVDKETLLEGAERNSDGSLLSIEFAWIKKGNKMHPTWESTILGHLKIFGKTLLVEVNSANRAKQIREEIELRLGSQATHAGTETETPEQMIKQAKQRNALRGAEEEIDQDDLMRDPEVRRQIEAEVQKQVEGWVHTKIPALGGRTPLQAVADPDGKEMVEALLQGWERQNEVPLSAGIVRPDINALRRLLNLPVKTESSLK